MMREEPVGESKPKSFVISKGAVWEAWRRVKANKGAAGVDGESIEEFERDLKGNLYKLWNRLSSGSYFPPPVRAVEIPKKDGSSRRRTQTPPATSAGCSPLPQCRLSGYERATSASDAALAMSGSAA